MLKVFQQYNNTKKFNIELILLQIIGKQYGKKQKYLRSDIFEIFHRIFIFFYEPFEVGG